MERSKRPAYIERRIALERQRRRADAAHVLPCDCPLHITPARIEELLAANRARNAPFPTEAPF